MLQIIFKIVKKKLSKIERNKLVLKSFNHKFSRDFDSRLVITLMQAYVRCQCVAWFLLARSEKGEATREARGAQQSMCCALIISRVHVLRDSSSHRLLYHVQRSIIACSP